MRSEQARNLWLLIVMCSEYPGPGFRTKFIFNLKDFLIAAIMNEVRKESSTLNSFGFENSVGLQILEMSYCLPFA